MSANVDLDLAVTIAKKLEPNPPKSGGSNVTATSPALSQQNTIFKPVSRKVAVILTEGFNGPEAKFVLDRLKDANLFVDIISERQGKIPGIKGRLKANQTFQTAKSVQYDAVYIVNGSQTNRKFNKDAVYFIDEAFSHYKPIGATHGGIQFLTTNHFDGKPGVIVGDDLRNFRIEFVKLLLIIVFGTERLFKAIESSKKSG